MQQHSWVEFYALSVRGLTRPGQRPLWFVWAALALIQIPVALGQALLLLLKTRPTAIVGFGGYAAFPPLFWGIFFKIPIFLHEQNLHPGMVTRIFARWAKTVFLTYPQTARSLRAQKVLVTGLPVRTEILSATPNPERFGLKQDLKTVLVFGGSRGSQLLTETVLTTRPYLTDVQFLIVTGDRSATLNSRGAHTVLVPYIHDMGTALATADVVICRAGAATLAELSALRKQAIIVPWAGAAGDHQTANAHQLVRSGSGLLLRESELTPTKLIEALHHVLRGPFSQTTTPKHSDTSALSYILREVLSYATPTDSPSALYRDRRRWHERIGESLP